MCRSRSALFVAAAVSSLSFTPAALQAQFPAEVRPGVRVRVWIPEPYRQEHGPPRRQLLRGTVEMVTADTLRLSIPGTANPLAIPRTAVRRLQLSQGEPSRPATAIERAIGGALGGAISFAAMNDPLRSGGPHYRTDWRAAGVGAAWGAGIGAVVGFIFPHEQWRGVRLRR
jgi:hypothetical protein